VSVLPIASIVVLVAALGASLVLLFRSAELRAGLLAAVLALLIAHPALELWQGPARAPGFDLATAADAAFLIASLLCVFVVTALWRTLGERDRIESLHWDAMEGVRLLGELGDAPRADFDAQLARLLEIGCNCFGAEVGIVSRVGGKRYEVIAIRAPASFPVAKGAVFPLEETCCAGVLGAVRTLALAGGRSAQPPSNAFRFEAYLGTAIARGDGSYGTLCFGSVTPRKRPFTATDKDLLRVMGQWLAAELARREAPRAPAPRIARPGGPERSGPARRRGLAVARSVDLNAVLGRVRRQLEVTAGPGIELELRAAPDLQAARDPRLPLDAIVLSLVRNAVDAMPEGGKLTLETANLEVAAGEPGVLPALEPNRYVTLSVRDTGKAIDAGALARVFEPPEAGAETEGRLPLATVYRLLQRCGGDLSVSVEPGRGTDFTVFLPLAEAAAAKPTAEAAAAKPTAEAAAAKPTAEAAAAKPTAEAAAAKPTAEPSPPAPRAS
jgi:GAF domain-containing protein